jgi:hypothetical protein
MARRWVIFVLLALAGPSLESGCSSPAPAEPVSVNAATGDQKAATGKPKRGRVPRADR